MELTMAATSNQVREPTNQADELTADELEHVSGGKGGKGDPKGQEYLVVTLKDVMISSV
jgi:bacteriocin-like protein